MSSDEEKISSLYQQGKEQGPPAHLDDAILRAAHEAVVQTRVDSAAKSPLSSVGWRVAMPVAAVLVITVVLAPYIKQYQSSSSAPDRQEMKPGLMMQQATPNRAEALQPSVKNIEKAKKRTASQSQTSRLLFDSAEASKHDAEKWLTKIRRLLDEGKFDAARKELDRFKVAYPDKNIDQSLIRQIENTH